jgi:hypothetical protein
MTSVTYSNWETDMTRAPKGKVVTRTVTTKDGQREFQSYEPDFVILMSECRKVIKSYWLPKEGRWAGFSEHSRPLAWQAWPEWNEGIAAHALELREGVSA